MPQNKKPLTPTNMSKPPVAFEGLEPPQNLKKCHKNVEKKKKGMK